MCRARWNGRIRKRAARGVLLSTFIVIMDFEQHAALLGFERAVMNAGRAAGIGRTVEGLAALALRIAADDQIARE
jgi:fatty acid desaturase